ncbi:MAG: hypothetical protein GY871_12240 [Actinomycetales bacterium]|nr:hypothetical protein [Actinomycetales bacterium]
MRTDEDDACPGDPEAGNDYAPTPDNRNTRMDSNPLETPRTRFQVAEGRFPS